MSIIALIIIVVALTVWVAMIPYVYGFYNRVNDAYGFLAPKWLLKVEAIIWPISPIEYAIVRFIRKDSVPSLSELKEFF